METIDFVVIGAGWAGLAAAKARHQIHPSESLAILDASPTAGGTWAEHRLYPGLKSNNMLGTYEYPDFPMDSETFGVQPGQHIPGTVVHAYLTKYAQHFGIFDKIRFEHKVESAEHQSDGGWILTARDVKAEKDVKIFAKRLVVATGLTSEPFLPHFDGQEEFGAPIFHGKDFLQYADTLETAKSVTVFGGTKTAWDLVYQYATKGIEVNWVIRETGHGPVWMAPPYVTPLKKWLEKLAHTRMLTWFSPCTWGDADGYVTTRNFYHGSFIGRAIVNKFWGILGGDVITLNQYDAHPETAKLKPWSQAFFVASSLSILNYDTPFFDLVKNGTVKVHIADINGLSERKVLLSDGTALETDALCCSTGWKHTPPMKFLPEGIAEELGIPHTPSPTTFPPQDLVEKIDKEILDRFPRLKDQPIQNKKLQPLLDNKGISTTDAINPSTPLTPYTLYHFIAPPSEKFLATRDIAFAGILMNFTVSMIAHAQSLWINAYFDDKIASLPEPTSTEGVEKFKHEAVLHSRSCKWRYPAGYGHKYPDFVFDAVPYLDLLLKDMGLNIYRKGGLAAEATDPYGPEDYKNLVEEWKEKQATVDA
ncbi:Fc.00g005590.m01.CDS01 [Cosmosporella sp. VM-42]